MSTPKRKSDTVMVTYPSHAIVPERDVNKRPVLECSHLGIEFGGLHAVDDFNLTIGRTEIAGLIGPNHPGDINDAWKDGHSGASEAVAEQAFKLGINVMYYAFNAYYARHFEGATSGDQK